jgi:integrase
MPTGKLKALKVARAKEPGMYGDGGGLWLQVSPAGTKSWIFRYWVPERDPVTGELVRNPTTNKVSGTSREMGLGSYTVVTLEEARTAAAEVRRLWHQGIDPIEARREAKHTKANEKAKTKTFKQCATDCIASHRAGWSAKHAEQWSAFFETYAYPVIGDLSVQAIDTDLVLKVLEPIWRVKSETAGRLRGRIECVLDWAKALKYRTGENPALWRGHLDKLLPKRSALRKVRKVRHHPALPYDQIGAFMLALRQRDCISARALEFMILCAVRTGDITGIRKDSKPGARWDQVDFDGRVWTIPSTKTEIELRVPLSDAALAVLIGMKAIAQSDYIFPGARPGKTLSDRTMLALVERMGDWRDKHGNRITPHGFRSTFRDWGGDKTDYPRDLLEQALAHKVGDETEEAYRRSDALEKRQRLMDAWGKFCASVSVLDPQIRAEVVPDTQGSQNIEPVPA